MGHVSSLAFGFSSAWGPSRCFAASPQMFGKRSQSQALLAAFPQQIPGSQGRQTLLTQAESMGGPQAGARGWGGVEGSGSPPSSPALLVHEELKS